MPGVRCILRLHLALLLRPMRSRCGLVLLLDISAGGGQVLVNAADHSSRNPPPDPKDKETKAAKRHMSELRVVIDQVRLVS